MPANAAEAQLRVGEALVGLSDDFTDFAGALEEAEARTAYMQARAAAIDDLIASGHAGRLLPENDDALGQELSDAGTSGALEEELDRLRRETGRKG